MLASLLQGGCYYSHLASGQLRLLWKREPIEGVLADPGVEERTRTLLGLVEPTRRFADELGLRVDDQYTSYVEWPGDRIVTTLVRTRPGSVEAVPFRFPFVGPLPYKGFFDRERAEAEARRMVERGEFDVCVSGVTAYSTLGWLDDPVTTPMLRRGAASLVETVLHELVHATLFVEADVEFNESVAQFIGQEAAVRFFEALESDPTAPSDETLPSPDHVRGAIEDRRRIASSMLDLREELARLESDPEAAPLRRQAEARTRQELAELPLTVLDPERVAEKARLDNACLALRGTYVRDMPRHAAVLEALGDDLGAMIARLHRVAEGELDVDAFYRISPADSDVGQLDHALLDEAAEDF